MPTATKGLVEVVLPAVKGLYTELPRTCFGESLKWGVLRIAEFSWAASVGSIFTLIISIATGKAGNVAVTLIGLLLAAVQVVFSSLLFIGACKNEPRFMKPWFWYAVVLCVLCMVLAIIGILAAAFLPAQAFVIYFVFVVFFCAILRYCAQVVYALMQQLQTASTDRKSIGASSIQDGHSHSSDSDSAQHGDDVSSNEGEVHTHASHYVIKEVD